MPRTVSHAEGVSLRSVVSPAHEFAEPGALDTQTQFATTDSTTARDGTQA